jgi:hypothetical protein
VCDYESIAGAAGKLVGREIVGFVEQDAVRKSGFGKHRREDTECRGNPLSLLVETQARQVHDHTHIWGSAAPARYLTDGEKAPHHRVRARGVGGSPSGSRIHMQ